MNENIGDLGLFMLQIGWKINTEKEFAFDTKILNSLENKFKRYIRRK